MQRVHVVELEKWRIGMQLAQMGWEVADLVVNYNESFDFTVMFR